ncbi:MAG: Gfo/Idh/MocA family oxidoreductase [Planctomycetes bacterium]|nr:Gfo/Idh/MocA family oxidoreductase [Planctomycetota bacterium]
MATRTTRRRFLRQCHKAAALGAAVMAGPSARAAGLGANERVRLAFIGCGIRHKRQIAAFMEAPHARVVAVCDVNRIRAERARQLVEDAGGGRPDMEGDFRRLLDRRDIDAVIVATPEHWKCLITVMACRAGKEVYVEKPLALTIAEGRTIVQAAREHKRVVMIGTQQRSMESYHQAVEFVQSGQLGRVSTVRSWTFENRGSEGYGNPPDGKAPPELDWDLWLGPAPAVPFNPNRFSQFHFFWDYGGGWQCDWGVHLFDVVHWAMKVDHPLSAVGVGGKFACRDNTEHPDTFEAVFEYPGFVSLYSYRHGNDREYEDMWYGNAFFGDKGTLVVNRDGWRVIPQPINTHDAKGAGGFKMPAVTKPGTPVEGPHQQHFVELVRAGRQPDVGDVETGHRSTIPGHLANISFRVGRKVYWDPAAERIKSDDEANNLLTRPYRAPWHL